MDLSDVRDHVEEKCEFPIEHDALIEVVGDKAIQAPTTETETIGSVLDRTSASHYRSAEAVYRAVKGNVGDAFVGPTNYDDRAGARTVPKDRHPTTSHQ